VGLVSRLTFSSWVRPFTPPVPPAGPLPPPPPPPPVKRAYCTFAHGRYLPVELCFGGKLTHEDLTSQSTGVKEMPLSVDFLLSYVTAARSSGLRRLRFSPTSGSVGLTRRRAKDRFFFSLPPLRRYGARDMAFPQRTSSYDVCNMHEFSLFLRTSELFFPPHPSTCGEAM